MWRITFFVFSSDIIFKISILKMFFPAFFWMLNFFPTCDANLWQQIFEILAMPLWRGGIGVVIYSSHDGLLWIHSRNPPKEQFLQQLKCFTSILDFFWLKRCSEKASLSGIMNDGCLVWRITYWNWGGAFGSDFSSRISTRYFGWWFLILESLY